MSSSTGIVREWLIRGTLLVGSLVFALVLAEVVVRAFFPLYDGRDNITLDGAPIKDWFEPGSVYRQISNEYDAVTTITSQGHRVPGTEGSPDIVFLGDSFTYGYGLEDTETFASIYCEGMRRSCANLGMPGSGTSRQVKRLEEFITSFGWRPKEVKLFFFGMSTSFSAGNDFVDNYNYGRWLEAQSVAAAEPPRREEPSPSLAARLIGWQSSVLRYSALMRWAKYRWGPLLKSLVLVDPGEGRMDEALMFTGRGLEELDALSKRHGFDYSLYLIVPVQDLIRGTDGQTLAALDGVAPKPAIATAPVLADAPARYYYAYDGHLNPEGSRRVAALLMDRDRTR